MKNFYGVEIIVGEYVGAKFGIGEKHRSLLKKRIDAQIRAEALFAEWLTTLYDKADMAFNDIDKATKIFSNYIKLDPKNGDMNRSLIGIYFRM